MDDAAKMYELQKVDLTWSKVKRRLMEIQKLLGESDELVKTRERVGTSQKELIDWQTKQRDAELESRSLAERIKDADDSLMSGAIHNPKELESLQASADSLRRQRAQVEDSAVEAMMAVDELNAQLEALNATYSKLEAEWQSNQDTLHAEEAKMRQNYILLKRKRDSVATEMDEALLEKYEQMRRRRGGVAVAKVNGMECGVCHVALPTGVVSALQANRDDLVVCTSCGRYLYQA